MGMSRAQFRHFVGSQIIIRLLSRCVQVTRWVKEALALRVHAACLSCWYGGWTRHDPEDVMQRDTLQDTLKVSFSMFPEKFLLAAGACVLLRKIVMFIAGYAWWLIPLKYQLSLGFPIVVI